MATNDFKLKVQAVLDKVKSIANIKADIKAIEAKLPKMKIQGTLDSTLTRKELNSKLKSVKPKVKVDVDTTQAEKKIKKIGKQKTNTTITPTVDTTQVVSGLKKAQKETKSLWERFTANIFGSNLIRMGTQKIIQAIHEAILAIKELDTIKTNIQMVSGTTNSEVNSMMQSYNAMAKELSSTTKEVSTAANEFLRMGESVANTNELVKNATILSKVGMIDSADAASYLISSMKGYQVSAENSIDIVSKLTAVDLEAAVSAGGLAEAISRCSNIANNSGTSMNRLIGYAASIGEVTQESMSVVGNSLKSMYSRMNNIKIGRYLDEETGESLSDTEAVLNKLGIQLRDTEDTYRNFDDVLDDVGKNWKNFTQIEQNAISVAIAGTMQRERFTALMNNYSSALEYSEVAANSAGSALERYGVYQDSIEAKTNELTAAIESLSTNIVSEELYSGIVQATTGLVEFLDKTNLLKGTLAGLVAMGVSKAIVSIGTGFITAAKSTAQLSAAMALFENGKSEQNLLAIGAACKGLSDQQLKLILSTKGLVNGDRELILAGMGVEEQEQQQTLATLGFAAAEDKATASTFSLSGAFKALKTAIVSNPVALLATALMAAAATIKGIIAVTKAFEQAQKKESDAAAELYEKSKQKIQSNKEEIKSFDELIRKYEELKSKSVMDSDTREEIKGIQYDIVDLVGSEAKTLDLVNGKLDEQLSKLKSISEEKSRQNVEDARDAYDNAKYLSDVMVGGADDYGNDVSVKWSDTEAAQIHKVEGFEKFTYQDFIKLLHDNGFGDIFRENNDGNLFNMRFIVDTKDIEGLEAKVTRLEELKDFLASNGLRSTGLYQGVNDAIGKYNEQNNNELESANNLVDAVVDNLSVSNEKLKEITVDSVESFEEYRQKMMDEAKSDGDISKMLADGILSNENLEISVNNYMATAEQFSEWYEQWKTGIEGAVNIEAPTLSISETVTKLNTQLKPTFDALKSAYQDIFTDDGKFALNSTDILSTCDSIKSKLDDMAELGLNIDYSSYEDFVRVLRNSESTEQNVKDAFDSLAASITSAGLSGAEDFETLKAALEDLGVVNEELVAFEALISNTEALKEAGLDLVNATDEQINAFANEMVSAENVSEAIAMLTFQKELCGLQDMNTAGEVANLLTLAENAGYTGEVIEHLTELEQIYQQVASGTLTPGQLDAKLARAEELQGLIKDSAGKINYEPKVDFSGTGGKKAASKAGKEAADAYLEAFEKELKDLDDLKDRGKITEKQYLDALRHLYIKFFNQKKKYLKEFEKYEHQYLDGMKSLYESAFSYITKQIDKRIDAIGAEKDAAVSALEAERDARLEEIEAEKKQYEEQIEAKEKEIKAKEKEIKAMQDANEERKHAIDLQKAEYELQRMQNQRTSLVYKDGQMSYHADTSGIRDAKQEVDDAKLEIDISKIEKEIDLLEEEKDKLQELIDALDKEAEKVNDHYDKLIAREEQRYDAMIKGMEDYKSQFEELTELFENAQMEAALSELGINMEALLSGSQEEFEKLKTAYTGILADMSRGNDEVIGQLSRLAGVNAESVSYLESTKSAFENLGGVTLEGLENSVDGVADSASGLTTSAGEVSDAVGSIQKSVDDTSQSITPLNEELEKLNKLITELTALFNGIEFPEIGDEGYAQKLSDIALAFGEIAVKCAEFQNIDFSSIIGTGASVTGGNGDPLAGGNTSDTQGQAGTGFMGLASAISEAVTSVSEQMDNLQTALQTGNDAFEEQINKIQEEYIPAWEELQTRLAEIIGVGGGDGETKGEGNQKSGSKDGGSESGGNGNSIIDIMQTGGDEVAARLEDPWLKAFNDFATDGDNSIQSICDKIIEMVKEMADTIQEQCAAAANALNALAETASASLSSAGGSVSGNTVSVTPHAEGTVGKAFAKGTGKYKGLPHDEKNAVRSEYGQPELTVYPDGKAELTTEPAMGALPKGTVIFNEEQTEQIMRNKGEVVGNAYAGGTVHGEDKITYLPDGTAVIPLSMKSLPYPMTDSSYWNMQMFMEIMEESGMQFSKSAKDISESVQNISNICSAVNNNNSYHQTQYNTYNVSLPNVTNESTAVQLMRELRELPRETYQYINRR